MSYQPRRWYTVTPGDLVRLRPKRAAGARVEVTVDRLLERHLADGLGFIDKHGQTFREYYYDLERVEPTDR